MNRVWRVLLASAVLALGACVTEREHPEDIASPAKRAVIHTELGATYLMRNQLDVAKTELEEALRLDSDNSAAHNVMALLQIRLKDDGKAEHHFRRSIGLDSNNSDARNNYGVFLCERGRYDDADEQFRTALKNPLYKNPEQADVNAGICRLKKSDKAAARQYFRAALQIDPNQTAALVHMARLSLESGESLSARGFMQRYFARAPETAETLLLAFRIERALGAKDAQATYALRLRGKFPDSAEVKQLRSMTGTYRP